MKKKSLIIGLITIMVVGSSWITLNNDKYFEIAKNLEIFTSIYKQLNNNYVDELDPNSVMRTGIDAMMKSLDPYTVYYSESQVESYRISLDDKYDGLGAQSKEIDGKVTITEIYKDGPSQQAGLAIGDIVTSVNGSPTEDRSYEDVIAFLRGSPGTEVRLGGFRPEENKEHKLRITRSQVNVPNVPYSGMLNEQIGYVSLTTFTQGAGNNIAKAIRSMRAENNLSGLVLDLRNNGGGLLAEAIDILGLFLDKGAPVVSTKGKVRERDQQFGTRRTPIDTELPVVVLINKRSASASEIVSGALQDYDRALIMGQRSFGKGLVQNTMEVGYNSRIKVTTSKYYIPSGRCIQSVAYENGLPKDIPDSQREVFKTKNGRPVLDGGGVTPDIDLEVKSQPEILTTLIKDNWIFHYANDYINSHSDVPEMKSFSFEEYDNFKRFLTESNFSYQTSVEKELIDLETAADKESYLAQDIASIRKAVASEKSDDIDEYKSEIIKEIEIELAKRYHFQEGKAFQKLKNDRDVDHAISILSDIGRYQKILRG